MAIVNIPEKVCPHCGGTRWAIEPGKTGFVRYRCPVLAQERRKRWKDKNPDLVKMHEQAHHEKRMAAQYFKKRREKLKNQTIINDNSEDITKNSKNIIKDIDGYNNDNNVNNINDVNPLITQMAILNLPLSKTCSSFKRFFST